MSYKNTMKVFSSNFALVWKQVLYFVVGIVFFGFCSYQVSKPLIDVFSNYSIKQEFTELFNGFYSHGTNFPQSLVEMMKNTFEVISEHFSEVYVSLILLFLFGFILPYIFFQIGNYNLCSIIYKKLSMNMNVSYFQNLIGTLKNSVIYALSNVVLSLPFFAVKVLAVEGYVGFAKNAFMSYFGLVILSGLFIFLNSIKATFYSCYVGNAVETENFAPVAFGSSLKTTVKNFAHILSTCVVLEITMIVANGFIGFFTFFAGMILSIPATDVLKAVCYIILYHNKTGQRYYLGNSVIYNPVKYEIKQDELAYKSVIIDEKSSEQIETTEMKKAKKKKNKKHGKHGEMVGDNTFSVKSDEIKLDFKKHLENDETAQSFGVANNHGEEITGHGHGECACGHNHGEEIMGHGQGECACGHNHGEEVDAHEENKK